MSSVSSRKRKKAQRQFASVEPRAARKTPASSVAHSPAKVEVRYAERVGLEWLAHKGKITARQHSAGKRYGVDFRVVEVNGMVPLPSCLDDSPRGSAGRSAPSMPEYDLQAQARLASARQALAEHHEMITACDQICGWDKTPWELTRGAAREADRMTQTLRIALDILSRHYALA